MRTLLFVILAAVSLSSCIKDDGGETETRNHIIVDDQVPDFVIENDLVGGYDGFRSPDDFTGKKSLLVFITTTCPHCRREMPFVDYAWRELEDEGLNVVAIARDADHEGLRKYWEDLELHPDMPHYHDDDRSVFDLFANQTVPRFYLVGEDAKVVWMNVGELAPGEFTEEKGSEFTELVKQKLNL